MRNPGLSSSDPGPRTRLLYSLLSAVVPGTGQLAAGYRRRGLIMLGMSLVLVVAGVAIYQQGLSTIFSWLVQPRILLVIFLLNLAVLVFRIGAVIDAYLAPRCESRSPSSGLRNAFVAIGLAILLTITAAPHAVLGYYAYLTHDTLSSVFSSQSMTEFPPPPTETPTPEPTDAPDNNHQ